MYKYIMAFAISVAVIASGIAGCYFFLKPSKSVIKFATEYEHILNKNLKNTESSIETNYNLRNMVKFRAKDAVCKAKQNKVICQIDRVYIGAPFSSYDAKNSKIMVEFIDDNTCIADIYIQGIFEIENNPYTNSFLADAGLNCRIISKYNKENGIFYNKYENCISNFDEIYLHTDMDYAYKLPELKNKNIYDSALLYYIPSEIDSINDTNNTPELSINNINLKISSKSGLFEIIHKYINTISKKEISNEKIVDEYQKNRKKIESDIKNNTINETDGMYMELLKQMLKASDGIMLHNYRLLEVDIQQKEKNKFYKYNNDIQNIMKNLIITVESKN